MYCIESYLEISVVRSIKEYKNYISASTILEENNAVLKNKGQATLRDFQNN